jgi:hypothetical protein
VGLIIRTLPPSFLGWVKKGGSWIIHASSDKTKVYTHPNFDLAKQYVDKIPMYGSEDSV